MAWAMIGGAAVSVVGGALLGGGSSGNSNPATYDPYAPYRPAAATQLNALMKDPSLATNSSYGQAMQQGASRAMASQGYTGSGNAIVAAANAGGQAYQQQFNNLSMLAGAGQSPAYGAASAANQGNINQANSNQMWGQIGNLAGNVINGLGNNSGGGGSNPGYMGGNGTGGFGMQLQSGGTDSSFNYNPNDFSMFSGGGGN